MSNDLKEKAALQVKEYEKKHDISLFEDLINNVSQVAEKCKIIAPHYFTNEYINTTPHILIENWRTILDNEEVLENSKESILSNNFAEEFKLAMLDDLESTLCKVFAKTFLTEWGKGNFQRGMEKFLQAMFCNKKNYEYFYLNSKEFASLANSIKEDYANNFKKDRNHWFNGYIKFQNVYLIIAMFPIALPYLLLKKLTKKILGLSTNKDKMLKDPYLIEMFSILEKAGYWK